MTTRKRKLLYALIALLFLMLLAVISWLVYLILSFRIEPPPVEEQVMPPARLHSATPGPVSEVLIRIAEEPAAEQIAKKTGTGAAAEATHGKIPSICEAYGPQIRGRAAYPNPLTHQSVFFPTRVTVTLNVKPDAP
jgi:hypothetical protein